MKCESLKVGNILSAGDVVIPKDKRVEFGIVGKNCTIVVANSGAIFLPTNINFVSKIAINEKQNGRYNFYKKAKR